VNTNQLARYFKFASEMEKDFSTEWKRVELYPQWQTESADGWVLMRSMETDIRSGYRYPNPFKCLFNVNDGGWVAEEDVDDFLEEISSSQPTGVGSKDLLEQARATIPATPQTEAARRHLNKAISETQELTDRGVDVGLWKAPPSGSSTRDYRKAPLSKRRL
jgi:hypothetical protein